MDTAESAPLIDGYCTGGGGGLCLSGIVWECTPVKERYCVKILLPPLSVHQPDKFYGKNYKMSTCNLAVGLHFLCVWQGRPDWLIFVPRLLGTVRHRYLYGIIHFSEGGWEGAENFPSHADFRSFDFLAVLRIRIRHPGSGAFWTRIQNSFFLYPGS